MLTRRDILTMIRKKGYFRLGPSSLKYTGGAKAEMGSTDDDFYSITFLRATEESTEESTKYEFLAEVTVLSTPRSLGKTIRFIKSSVEAINSSCPEPETKRFPLVIAPYLSKERLDDLVSQGVSGLDLCGNGVLIPDDLFVFETGGKNLYPQSTRLRNVYQLKSSLVPRVLLIQPEHLSVTRLVEFLNTCGSDISFPTVSKVLKQLEEDLVIAREAKSLRQIQPEKILDALGANYRPPKIAGAWLGRCNAADLTELIAPLQQAASAQGKRFVLTGSASANQYCAFGGEQIVSVYTDASIAPLLGASGGQYEEGRRFANLEVFQTFSDWVYFDPRDKNGLKVASPIQAYLELVTGDPRQRQAAGQIRQQILADPGDGGKSQ